MKNYEFRPIAWTLTGHPGWCWFPFFVLYLFPQQWEAWLPLRSYSVACLYPISHSLGCPCQGGCPPHLLSAGPCLCAGLLAACTKPCCSALGCLPLPVPGLAAHRASVLCLQGSAETPPTWWALSVCHTPASAFSPHHVYSVRFLQQP